MQSTGRGWLRSLAVGVVAVGLATQGAGVAQARPSEPAGPAAAPGAPGGGAVVVRGLPGHHAAVRADVVRLGGHVTRDLPIVDGVAATVSAAAAAALAADPDVVSVTEDVSGHVMAYNGDLGYDPTADTGSILDVATIIGATKAYQAGWTGKGIDVALIDTGVAPVKGLTSGNVVNGPDLSFDSQHADVRYKDAYGHGTHMASIIAGRDQVESPADYAKPDRFHGIAPDARIISLKVGASDGAADVSQVIAAIDWVTQHAHDPGMNIRVLNLSYGTDGKQDSHLDPLAYAAEAAWRKGIVVVVAGGNDGTADVDLANPALDGNLLAVGASDPMGTLALSDDTVPAFANRGTSKRHVDMVAPGVHILGLRVPNGAVDQAYPSARVGTRFFRGSGTSQSTAVVSGAAALLLQRYPGLSPQQVKMILGYSAQFMAKGTTTNAGAGIVNVSAAMSAAGNSFIRTLMSTTTATFGTGLGSLELARGSSHVGLDGVALSGERDIFGAPFVPLVWAPKTLLGTAWTADGSWNGNAWTGAGFDAAGDWSGRSWVAASWTGTAWSGRSWVGRSWVNNSWDGRSWVADSWQGRSWVDAGWSSATWS
ncbi:S8 family serine peptidase [Kineosporia sp. A_224]|uniref:S8 family serine peptidase n=1 Tax=Kineosporia sp. A_224 TaxID=1962180 RepID=UPI000B4A8662|nr:S8 family serine peptidase [Kineosporia sp. A_224]